MDLDVFSNNLQRADLQRVANLHKSPDRNAVGAPFVLLYLLERYPKSLAKVVLRNAARQSYVPDSLSNFIVDPELFRVRSPLAHAPYPTLLVQHSWLRPTDRNEPQYQIRETKTAHFRQKLNSISRLVSQPVGEFYMYSRSRMYWGRSSCRGNAGGYPSCGIPGAQREWLSLLFDRRCIVERHLGFAPIAPDKDARGLDHLDDVGECVRDRAVDDNSIA